MLKLWAEDQSLHSGTCVRLCLEDGFVVILESSCPRQNKNSSHKALQGVCVNEGLNTYNSAEGQMW